MKIESVEVCPTCYGLRYNITSSSSYVLSEDGNSVVEHPEDNICPTCKGHGIVLVITEVPKDITIINRRL
jgi:hypothetical protein